MHSLAHDAYAHAHAADRLRSVPRGTARTRRRRPPPMRRHAAYAVGRLAGRLDLESARRAVA